MNKKSIIKKEVDLLEKRASFRNFKKGIDEEKIYGPMCIFWFVVFLLLYFTSIINLKILIVGLILVTYIFFIYFPFHRSAYNLISLFSVTTLFAILGFFIMLDRRVSFSNIEYISIFWLISIAISLLIEYIACRRYSLEKVDIMESAGRKKLGSWFIPFFAVIAFFTFFMFATTYYLFGKEHIYLWLPILFFWIIAGIRLIRYDILCKK